MTSKNILKSTTPNDINLVSNYLRVIYTCYINYGSIAPPGGFVPQKHLGLHLPEQ